MKPLPRPLSGLKEHRERRGLTQHELAKLADVSRPPIARLETTDSAAKYETAQRLARVLRVKPEDLAGRD